MSRTGAAVRLALLLAANLPLGGCGALMSYLAPPRPTAGQRVRAIIPDSTPPARTGLLVTLTDDSVVLARDSTRLPGEAGAVAGRFALSLDVVDEIDVSRGIHRRTVSGVLIGGLLGSLGGLAVLCTRIHDCLGRGDADPPLGQGFTIIVASFGAGAVVGGTIGAFVRGERWDEVPLSALHRVRADALTGSRSRLEAGLRLYPAFLDPRRRPAR